MEPDFSSHPLRHLGPRVLGGTVLLIAVAAVVIAAGLIAPILTPPATMAPTTTPGASIATRVTVLPALRQVRTTAVELPTSDCHVQSALGSIEPAPGHLEAQVPMDVAGQMSAYWLGRGAILGPTNWNCQAAIGQDGSWQGSISAPSGMGELRFLVFPGAPAMDMVDLACPLFGLAAEAMAAAHQDCSVGTPPAAELDTWITEPTSIRFEDQPGVIGTGNGSGGTVRAIGALVYVPGSVAAQLTCLLPESGGGLCDAVVNDFAARLDH